MALCACLSPCEAQTETHAVRDFPDSAKTGGSEFNLHKSDRILIRSSDSETRKTHIGDTLIIQSPSAMVLDENAQVRFLDLIKREKAIKALSESLMQTGEGAIAKNDTLQTHWQAVHRIDSIAFQEMRTKYDSADRLITRCTDNTGRVIFRSYVTAVVLGVVAGGLTGGAIADDRALGIPLGAGIGAVAGGLLNFIVLKIPISLGSK